MKIKLLREAAALAKKTGHVFVATADGAGLPHMAAAGKLTVEDGDLITAEEWFCPGTMANLERNRRVALVVWDPAGDRGYQLFGSVEKVEDRAIMDGCSPAGKEIPMPQVDRRLHIRVNKVSVFKAAPHTDLEAD